MKWYDGDIAEAIMASKAKSAIFVVYTEGPDETSAQFSNLIENPELTRLLESDKFVAIKLTSGSVSHQQFSEIYKNVSVPSLYFIGKNGQKLDIITEVSDLPTILSKIDSVVLKASGGIASPAENSLNFIASEQQGSAVPPNVVCDNGVCSIVRDEPSETSTPTPSQEEKVAKAKKLLQKQKEQKEIEEKEKERQKELERRKMGQDVQQLKRWQEDQELKQLKEERDREKRENQAARDRVLAQIAQDKAERASKFSSSTPTTPPPVPAAQGEPKSPPPKSDTARLQFKLPDGSSSTQDFPSSENLQAVRDHIAKNLKLTCATYTLSTTFPRREFADADNDKTLLDLGLTPNAVILILPTNRGTVTTNQGTGLTGLLWMVLSPIFTVLGYLRTFLFGGAAPAADDQSGPSSYSASRGPNTVLHVRNKYDWNTKLSSAGRKLVVIDFFATWCGPCRMIAPRLEELAKEFRNVVFLKVDVDENRDIASDYKVSAMPTFVFIKNKSVLTTFSGADYYQIKDTIARYK